MLGEIIGYPLRRLSCFNDPKAWPSRNELELAVPIELFFSVEVSILHTLFVLGIPDKIIEHRFEMPRLKRCHRLKVDARNKIIWSK